MATARAAVLLAAAAHGTGEHRHAAQIRIQHSMQPCASSPSATPAMPSTMLHHVDIEFVTSTNWAPEVDVWSRRRPARRRIDTGPGWVFAGPHPRPRTQDQARTVAFTHGAVKCSLVFAYEVEDPTLYIYKQPSYTACTVYRGGAQPQAGVNQNVMFLQYGAG